MSDGMLFEKVPDWEGMWKGMPGYLQEDLGPKYSIKVHFSCKEDMEDFSKLIDQNVYERTRSIWHPKVEKAVYANKCYVSGSKIKPKYPIYIISKGRWESRLTSKTLEQAGVDYKIVVEPQEFDKYAEVIDESKILVTPFSNLGQGSIPVRNWVWEHSIEQGAERHWILDDNIDGLYRLFNNTKIRVESGVPFRIVEDFVDRYENIGMSGMHYLMFAPRKYVRAPFFINTRVYSCILLKNDLDMRWRGRYNEDTDLSIRILKSGLCTVLFNAFLINKMTTMTMTGGNTEDLYEEDGRLQMAESLVEQHPDVVKVTKKWGRPQHSVNYGRFKRNKFVLKEGVKLPEEENNYGLRLVVKK